jgi:hypothetical protein
MALMKQLAEKKDRTPENINSIPRAREGGIGVYILFDRSMPVYVGKGHIAERIRRAAKSETRGSYWDQFSWYIPHDPKSIGELEAMLHRMLPDYPLLLNKRIESLKDRKGKRLVEKLAKKSK